MKQLRFLIKYWIYPLVIVVMLSILLICCKKDEVPVVVPTLTTTRITSVMNTSAYGGGIITSEGGASVTERGVCWNSGQLPTIEDNRTADSSGSGLFTIAITRLTASTKYYVRAYATNSAGTGYGNEESFTTTNYKTVTDFENNIYNTILIGNQFWMRENLRSTRFNDGTAIPAETNIFNWLSLNTPGYCCYIKCCDNNYEPAFKTTYGALYNWYSVNTGKLCPTGWHVPDDADWTTLITYLGGLNVAGGKLKEADTLHWKNPNNGGTNESDFSVVPGGQTMSYSEVYNGIGRDFDGLGTNAFLWSADEYSESHAMYIGISNTSTGVSHSSCFKTYGNSVRCIKD